VTWLFNRRCQRCSTNVYDAHAGPGGADSEGAEQVAAQDKFREGGDIPFFAIATAVVVALALMLSSSYREVSVIRDSGG
jgi:hypothetical protein